MWTASFVFRTYLHCGHVSQKIKHTLKSSLCRIHWWGIYFPHSTLPQQKIHRKNWKSCIQERSNISKIFFLGGGVRAMLFILRFCQTWRILQTLNAHCVHPMLVKKHKLLLGLDSNPRPPAFKCRRLDHSTTKLSGGSWLVRVYRAVGTANNISKDVLRRGDSY